MPLERWFADVERLPEIRFHPVSAGIARLAGAFDDPAPRDPADRLIAATAVKLGGKLVTADRQLLGFPLVETVW